VIAAAHGVAAFRSSRWISARAAPGRGSGARAARDPGSSRATAQYDIGKPTRTNCAIGGAAIKLRRLVWFGIRQVPRESNYGGLSFGARSLVARLERCVLSLVLVSVIVLQLVPQRPQPLH
jgi:hypothetical protein